MKKILFSLGTTCNPADSKRGRTLTNIGSKKTFGRRDMQLRLFIALPFLVALSGCNEEIQAQDPPITPPAERAAIDVPHVAGETETPDIELQVPVGFD
ncbi:MAG: hypothetical protein Q8Q79_10515 [Sphingopyxis sp.]|nr:hypothetical protein [Sphingopyxis sp.]